MVMRGEDTFRGGRAPLDAQVEFSRRMLAEDRVGARLGDLQLEMAAVVRDIDALQAVTRRNDATAINRGGLRRKGAHCRLDQCSQRFARRGRRGQQGDPEAGTVVVARVRIVVVVVVTLVRIMMVVATAGAVFVRGFVRVVAVPLMGVGFGAGAQRDNAGLELKNPGPLERVLGLEEGRVHRQRAIEVEGADAEHLVDRHIGIAGSEHLGGGIDGAHPTLDALEFGGCHQVGLVEQDHVGEGDLFAGFIHLVEVLLDVARIDDGHDGVEHELLLEVVVQEEGLRDRAGIGHPGGLDDDVVELVAPLEQLAQDAQQVAAQMTSWWSTPTSPNSFSITAMRLPWFSERMRLRRVVLPDPRNPVSTVTGTRSVVAIGDA